jgi:uncharacterized protein
MGNKMIKEEILSYLRTHQEEFKNKYQISKMALFGSYARGENNISELLLVLKEMKNNLLKGKI